MTAVDDFIQFLNPYIEVLQLILVIIIAFMVFSLLLRLIKRVLLKKIKRKKQIANAMVFLDIMRYLFAFFAILIVVAYYYGSWGEFSFIAGLLTVALGWALQKPISGVVAWLIIVTRRPFIIGDRVIISNIKGDVSEITLTHIFLDEVGGTIDGEETSGRTVMIPTSIIFEQEVINYTEKNDYIIDEVITAITYESNLQKAEKLIIDAVSEVMKPYWQSFPKRVSTEPHIRLMFRGSGIDVVVRYHTIATQRNAIATDIRRVIFNQIRKTPDVEIAYPHTEVLFREKG